MIIKDELVLYESIYKAEVERREKLLSRMSLPIALITAILGGWAYMVKSFSLNERAIWGGLFLFFIILTFAAVSLMFYFLTRSLYGFVDKLMPAAQELKNYHDTLCATYDGYTDKDALVDKYFNDFMRDSYVKYATINSNNNDLRLDCIYKSLVLITIIIFLSFFGFVCFSICQLSSTTDNVNFLKFLSQLF